VILASEDVGNADPQGAAGRGRAAMQAVEFVGPAGVPAQTSPRPSPSLARRPPSPTPRNLAIEKAREGRASRGGTLEVPAHLREHALQGAPRRLGQRRRLTSNSHDHPDAWVDRTTCPERRRLLTKPTDRGGRGGPSRARPRRAAPPPRARAGAGLTPGERPGLGRGRVCGLLCPAAGVHPPLRTSLVSARRDPCHANRPTGRAAWNLRARRSHHILTEEEVPS